MNKILFSIFAIMCLTFSNASAQSSTRTDETKPFVGHWGAWRNNCFHELTIDLYSSPADGYYGIYSDRCEDGTIEYRIVRIHSIKDNMAELEVENNAKKKYALLNYSPGSEKMTFVVDDNIVVFGPKHKYAFAIIHFDDNINVLDAPVSGATLLKARRGQTFPLLGTEQGWLKVQLSATDKRVGYISQKNAKAVRDVTIPNTAFSQGYKRGLVSFELNRSGNQVTMTMTTMRPPIDGHITPALLETYAGNIENNAIILTHWENGYSTSPDINKMTKLKQPLVAYYVKDNGMFIIDGENYWAE